MATTIDDIKPLTDSPPKASNVLEPQEEQVLSKIWQSLSEKGGTTAQEGKAHLSMALVRLEKIWEAIEVHPSILDGETLGARHRDIHSLIDTLSASHPFSTEVFLPNRGVLCRAFLHAKLNFCRLFSLIIDEMLFDDPNKSDLEDDIERIQTSAVCNIMAEDLLRVIGSDQTLSSELRRKATWVLLQMWEDRACQIVPRFFPVLDSMWQAKSHITVSYGTLTGATEIMAILGQGCDPVFVDCFSRDDVTDEQEYALQEFVFNISYEQLTEIQTRMTEDRTSSIDALAVAKILKIPVTELHILTNSCEEMLFTFRERQSMANHRRALNLPGPKRTAEEYLMTYLLELSASSPTNSLVDK